MSSVAYSSNEQFIIFAPADKTIRIWNAVSRLFKEHTIDKVTSGIVNCLLQGSDCGVQHATWGHCKPREGHGITVAWRQTLQCPLPLCVLPYDSQHVSFPPLYYPEEVTYLDYLLKSSSTSSSSNHPPAGHYSARPWSHRLFVRAVSAWRSWCLQLSSLFDVNSHMKILFPE